MKKLEKEAEVMPLRRDGSESKSPLIIGVFLEIENEELINQISLSLMQAINYFNVINLKSFGEASKGLVEINFDLLITDSDLYLNLAKKYNISLFKVKIENSFSYSADNLKLESKPFIYENNSNIIRIREKSIYNTRFLYEIFNIALNPPSVNITFSCTTDSEPYMEKFCSEIKKIFPFISFSINIENIITESIFDIDITVQRNNNNKIIQIMNSKKSFAIPHRMSFTNKSEDYMSERTEEFIKKMGDLFRKENYIDFFTCH